MSLQVWLPFIKGLTNQGISSLSSITLASGNSLTVNGKLGGQAITLTKLQTILPTLSSMTGAKEMSYAFWVKVNTAWEAQWLDGIRWISTDGSTTHTSRQEFYTNCTKVGTWFQGGSISGKDFTPGVWTHIAGTFNYNTGEVKFYLNGILQGTSTALATTHYCRGDFYIGDNGVDLSENDIRIYDHCLSQKEVEEITKGLILHYKLDDTYAENSNIISCNITETAYNASISKYGYNDASNLIKTIGNFQGKNCVKIGTRVAEQQACPYAYFGNLFTSDGTNAPAYKALSFDYYTTVPTTTWLNIYKLGSGQGTAAWKTINSDGVHSGTYTNSANSIVVKPNEWNHVEVIFHGTTASNAEWGYCINGPAHTTNENYYFLYANIQLEENDHATGYGNNFHQSIIYDSSGYNNNGTIIGEIELNNNSPRYTVATYINSSDPTTNSATGEYYISADCGLVTPTEISIAWWANPESGYGGSISHAMWSTTANDVASDYQVSAFNHRDTGFDVNSSDGVHLRLSTSSFVKNEWHYYVVTYDGQTAKLYKDGIQQTSVAFTAAKTLGTFTKILIGHSRAGGVHRKMKGIYSDFRVYATALTEDQILELYHTSATIDNNGNVYVREVVE